MLIHIMSHEHTGNSRENMKAIGSYLYTAAISSLLLLKLKVLMYTMYTAILSK